MITLTLVGIGTGNAKHLTLQAIEALNQSDLILIPRKGPGKDDLAELRLVICNQVLQPDGPVIHEFVMPERDPAIANYETRVQAWHSQTALVWSHGISQHLGNRGRVAFLVWGDPSLYDSTLRIADRLASTMATQVEMIPGITSIQTLTAGHAISLNELAEPFIVTTGRRLRENGWPEAVSTVVVMLDKGGAFTCIDPAGVDIWWSAYAGMPQEIKIAGPLQSVSEQIVQTRAVARERHGWIMDIYLMRRRSGTALA
ncbi:precorrin-6A synthase (deacetylating) [Granulosicoccus antarcticus]|uniref:Tetrapyrrole methylase domain-containing protein n=1 Tax=Granulosicoccus antarcticus IMCC3135 TaxID=1192854 RepID=A0A2Z2NKH2_9GAMM|nr:precorrin-6A synthase (deacetylating) [Granulosicoccus antarcticus]ASJ71892.1 hypothetical protein IMCC3135_08975 [Granulosicoccus antarcticus IMCC3135]